MTGRNSLLKRRSILSVGAILGALLVLVMVAPQSVQRARAGDVPGSGDPPLPSDVYTNLLADYGITTTAPPPGTGSGTTAAEAAAVAASEYDFMGGTIASTHFVLYSDPEFCDVPTEEDAGEEDATCTPAYMNYPAWLVVIRNGSQTVSVPDRAGATYPVTVAVFVDASTKEEIGAVTLDP